VKVSQLEGTLDFPPEGSVMREKNIDKKD